MTRAARTNIAELRAGCHSSRMLRRLFAVPLLWLAPLAAAAESLEFRNVLEHAVAVARAVNAPDVDYLDTIGGRFGAHFRTFKELPGFQSVPADIDFLVSALEERVPGLLTADCVRYRSSPRDDIDRILLGERAPAESVAGGRCHMLFEATAKLQSSGAMQTLFASAFPDIPTRGGVPGVVQIHAGPGQVGDGIELLSFRARYVEPTEERKQAVWAVEFSAVYIPPNS